jgi:hypothetical protein
MALFNFFYLLTVGIVPDAATAESFLTMVLWESMMSGDTAMRFRSEGSRRVVLGVREEEEVLKSTWKKKLLS